MQDEFKELCRAIYSNDDELRRFRQLMVNLVLATDLFDAELQAIRNSRWDKAFGNGLNDDENEEENPSYVQNRKLTCVIEHLIKVSDVAHTMQHFDIYLTWNQKFFFECYKAYAEGRAAKDPSEKWYEGEIGFFDGYIIPLADKLDKCGCFGILAKDYLANAVKNRREWQRRGRDIVREMKDSYQKSIYSTKSSE